MSLTAKLGTAKLGTRLIELHSELAQIGAMEIARGAAKKAPIKDQSQGVFRQVHDYFAQKFATDPSLRKMPKGYTDWSMNQPLPLGSYRLGDCDLAMQLTEKEGQIAATFSGTQDQISNLMHSVYCSATALHLPKALFDNLIQITSRDGLSDPRFIDFVYDFQNSLNFAAQQRRDGMYMVASVAQSCFKNRKEAFVESIQRTGDLVFAPLVQVDGTELGTWVLRQGSSGVKGIVTAEFRVKGNMGFYFGRAGDKGHQEINDTYGADFLYETIKGYYRKPSRWSEETTYPAFEPLGEFRACRAEMRLRGMVEGSETVSN